MKPSEREKEGWLDLWFEKLFSFGSTCEHNEGRGTRSLTSKLKSVSANELEREGERFLDVEKRFSACRYQSEADFVKRKWDENLSNLCLKRNYSV